MSLNAAMTPPASVSSRFFRVSYLPTYGMLLFLLILVWAGAPRSDLHFKTAWKTAANLGAAELVLIALVVLVGAMFLQPLQLGLVRILEGSWPKWLYGWNRKWQLSRKHRLEVKAAVPSDPGDADKVREAGIAATRLRQRFPLEDGLVRPTALGNALTAIEDTAGRSYGMDGVCAWPRLYAVLGDRTKAVVDDRRDAMDAAARMAATAGATAIASLVLLLDTAQFWWLLALIPAFVSVLSYHGAVRAAVAYGEAVQVAFDLHRFDLLKAVNSHLPASPAEEIKLHRQLGDLWRQGVPPDLTYAIEEKSDEEA